MSFKMAFKDFDIPDYLKDAESFKVTKMSLADRLFVIKYKAVLKDVISGNIAGEEPNQIKLWITGNWDLDSTQLENKADKKGFFPKNIELLVKGFSTIYSGQASDYIAEIKEILKRKAQEDAKVQVVSGGGGIDEKEKKPRVIEHYVQKYHNVWEGNELHEAILIGNDPYFVCIDRDYAVDKEETSVRSRRVGGFSETSAKDSTTTKIMPKGLLTYINKPYIFDSQNEIDYYLDRASRETLDTMYSKVKGFAKKYIDASDIHHTILAADTVFTWFQDIFGQTHYLYFYGDNNSGKTINLQFLSLLGYRAMYDVDITDANIYTYLGSVEEGQGIILEDEADGLDYKQDDKMRIYKKGYNSGGKVSRTETGGDSGRRQDGYYVYCFKAFSGEKKLDPDYAKGFNERTFYLECQEGNPQYDLSEVVSPAGAEELEDLSQEIEDTRKLLLAFRLVNHTKDFPNIEIAVRNREKQLTKPLIRLFQNTDALNEISKALGEMIANRRGIKRDTLEYAIYTVVKKLIETYKTYRFHAKLIYTSLKDELDGKYKDEENDQSFETPDHGKVPHRKINTICEDRFGAKKERANNGTMLVFDADRFRKVETAYSLEGKGIEIIKEEKKLIDDYDKVSESGGVGCKGCASSSDTKQPSTEKQQEINDENRTKMLQNIEELEEEEEETEESEEEDGFEND
jgi:hypothetical protein